MLLWNRTTNFSRRDFLKLSTAGVMGASMSGWLNVVAARAAESKVKHKSCILLWMAGGPSHKDTFDLKPGSEGGGPFKPSCPTNPSDGIPGRTPFLNLYPCNPRSALLTLKRSRSTVSSLKKVA